MNDVPTPAQLANNGHAKARAKVALITGVTGQDGAYLAALLIEKGYVVHGIKRRSSQFNTARIDHLYQGPQNPERRLILHHADMTDGSSLQAIVDRVRPDEIYNLAAQSHVAVSFDEPEYTANTNGLGTLRLLEAIRIAGLAASTRFYQASTSELFGQTGQGAQHEGTPFAPRSPYAAAKLYAYWITVSYRESYGLFACNGILFNHESPLRGETFVTRKITRSLSRIALGIDECLYLGNLDALRDWGHARDYVQAQWLMLQLAAPRDLVIASGAQHSVRDFVNACAQELGVTLAWRGAGVGESAAIADAGAHRVLKAGQVVVRVAPRYFRPNEVDSLLGDATLAQEFLGWRPSTTFTELVSEMMAADMGAAKKYQLIRRNGYVAHDYHT